MERITFNVKWRRALAARLNDALSGVEGIETPRVRPGDTHSYWRYCLDVDPEKIPGGTVALGGALKEHGVPAAPRYIQKPAFQCEVFREQRTFGKSRFPFTLARPEAVDYSEQRFPGTFRALSRVLVLPWNERFTEEHVDHIARAVRESVARLRGESA